MTRKIFSNIAKYAAAAFLAVAAVSCGEDEPDVVQTPAKLTLKNTEVAAEAGSMFVSVEASGDWTITVSSGSDWVSVSPSSGTGSKNNVILTYTANTSSSSRIAKLLLTASSSTSEAAFSQAGTEESSVPTTHYGADVSDRTWIELPKTYADDGRDMMTVFMKQGSNDIRNYSYDWSYGDLVSYWVAYPLNKSLRGSGSRSNTWGLDPNLPTSLQSNISAKDYKPSETFARGHQCPSADRLVNYNANTQTFYGTNMTPQMHVFNEGIWVNLENRVRNWGDACDTLYVVTGCVVADNSTSGSFGEVGGFAYDNDGKKVAIPVGYYKAVVRYQKNSTHGYDGYSGLAIYLDHKNYGTDASVSKDLAISIDDLEKKLGIDLFVNLPKVIGEDKAAKVEAQQPKDENLWW